MPKDRTENIDRYKVRGGHLNEYEYQQNEGALEESREGFGIEDGEGLRGAAEPNAPQNLAERIRQVEEAAHEKVERRRAKRGAGGATTKGAAKSPGSKKKSAGVKRATTARGAKKSSAAKKSAKKSAKKGAAGKRAAKGGAKKGVAKKGSRARK